VLGPEDPLSHRPRRVVVAGTSGSGKTTLARRVGGVLDLPVVELDALYHGPGWTERAEFVSDVQAFAATEAWVCEWQYGVVRDLLADRCDLMVWLDLPRRTVMRQVVVRTVVRRLWRIELWNGNREGPLRTIFTEPDHIVRWAWRRHGRTPPLVTAVARRRPELPVVRLRSRREIEIWLRHTVRRP
jgi:adenylate kinase family enzyme